MIIHISKKVLKAFFPKDYTTYLILIYDQYQHHLYQLIILKYEISVFQYSSFNVSLYDTFNLLY